MRVVYALWLRQLKRYFRAKSRIVGAIGQPLLFLLALGYGIGSIYNKGGAHNSYIIFLVPGIMIQTVLFSAVFFGANIIFDKQFGFLKETLVTPVSRFKIMIGGALGGATTSVLQGCLVFIISLFLGFRPYNWFLLPAALGVLVVLAVALASLSSAIGSIVNDMQGFQAINQFLIFPLYFLSGALYPLTNVPTAMRYIADANPISYAVDALRTILINQSHYGYIKDFSVLILTMIVFIFLGAYRFRKLQA